MLCRDAISWLPELERGDAEVFVQWLLDSVIDLLRDDPVIPFRAVLAWELIFADLQREAEEELSELIEGKIDRYEIDEIVSSLVEEEEAE